MKLNISGQLFPIEPSSISLSGEWLFRADPSHVGDDQEWFSSEHDASSWQRVTVPHTWNVMDEHYDFDGEAWYRLEFTPEIDLTHAQVYLQFEAVYYRAEVWLNNEYFGEHEGGYTPFRFDVSGKVDLERENTLVVKVDNYRRSQRVPDDVFDWWNYGGIVRDVSLEMTSKVFVDRQRIIAVPNITDWNTADSAQVTSSITIANTSVQDFEGKVTANIYNEETGKSALEAPLETGVNIPAGERIDIELMASVPSPVLWHFDQPHLYIWETTLLGQDGQAYHTDDVIFGIRSIELIDGQFILNGEPVRLVGMTRHADSPAYGLAEPVSFMAADYDDMKRLNMVFSRPVHYPQDKSVLDYCDRNGILLIPEIPAWQIETSHLGNKYTLATARQQISEMILSSYNHPSIWAWSVGNEIASNTPQGRDYVAEMVELAHDLDPTRPVGFASFRLFNNQERDATALTDFVLMNEYAGSWHGTKEDLPIALDRIHELWPEKVVVISEFGLEAGWSSESWMGDTSGMDTDEYYYIQPGTPSYSEEVYSLRSQLIMDQMDVFRSRSFVAGAIFWTYQDYRSNMDFQMGLLDRDRRPTPVVDILREQYSPIRNVSISIPGDGTFFIELQTRGPIESDLPVYTLRGYTLHWEITSLDGEDVYSEGNTQLPTLAPEEKWSGEFSWDAAEKDVLIAISVIRPTGFSIFDKIYTSDGELLSTDND